jgi:hypothetical protein
MAELVKESKDAKNADFGLSNFLSKLNGNRGNMDALVDHMMVA